LWVDPKAKATSEELVDLGGWFPARRGFSVSPLRMSDTPLEDISILTQPDENLELIMKDGLNKNVFTTTIHCFVTRLEKGIFLISIPASAVCVYHIVLII
jgi:hypothetical protein